MGEDHGGELYPDADVHPVGLGGDLHFPANLLHPLAAAAAHGDHALVTGVAGLITADLIAAAQLVDAAHRGIEVEVHLVLKVGVEVFQHHIVDVGAQMPDGGIQQVQVILNAELLELGSCSGVELGALAAVGHVDLVHVFHQVQGPLFADVLKEGAAEIVGDVVLAVGEGPRAAEAGHDGAGLAADAGLDGGAVDGALPLIQGVTGLKHADLQVRIPQHQLIGGKNAAGARADNEDIVIHRTQFSYIALRFVEKGILLSYYTMLSPFVKRKEPPIFAPTWLDLHSMVTKPSLRNGITR